MNRILKISLSVFILAILIGVGLIMFPKLNDWNIFKGDKKDTTVVNAEGSIPLHFFIPKTEFAETIPEDEDFIRTYIEDKFQAEIKMTWLEPNHEYHTTLSTLLFSNNPPDLWLNLTDADIANAANSNTIADVSFFITPKRMPNYFDYWITEKVLKDFQLPNTFIHAPVPYDRKSYRSYYIRQDWLDRLKLEVPTNYEQYLSVLQAFTNDDPDGNGLMDTYGFTTSGNGSQLSTEWPEFLKHDLIYPYYINNEGSLIDMQSDLRVEMVIEDILQVIQMGVVDPDWFLNQNKEHIHKAIQGKAGIVLSDQMDFAFESNPFSIQNRTKKLDPNAKWVPFNPFGNAPLRAGTYPQYSFVFSNMSSPEKMIKITEILDWLSSEEGFLMTHYGQENVHYTREGNSIHLKDKRNDPALPAINSQWQFFTPPSPEVFGLTVHNPELTEHDQQIYQYITNIPVLEGVGTILTPPIGVDVQAMRNKQDEFQTKLLFEERSAANWPAYRKVLMEQYQGNTIFKQYAYKIKAAKQSR